MSDYLIHGKKGHGKTLICVGRIRDALRNGRCVATNLDINLEHLLRWNVRNVRIIRLPDRPSIADLELIGIGSDKLDESTYGELVLDELATWMNARTYQDKGRQSVLAWLAHSRKFRWNTNLICQGPEQIDKQVRDSLIDHSVTCTRMDKLRIPFLGVITKNLLGFEVRPPKFHVATVRYGMSPHALKVDRWAYLGRDLYPAYNTEQAITDDYPHGAFSYLSPWHTHGRYTRLRMRPSEWLKAVFTDSFPKRPQVFKPQLPIVSVIAQMPIDERVKHIQRLERLGVLEACQ